LRYNFDWDPAKEKQNIRKHKVAFRRAATVFRDPNQLSIYDGEHSEGEDRWITIGIDSGGILRVSYTRLSKLTRTCVKSASSQHAKQPVPKRISIEKGTYYEGRIQFF